MTDWIWVLIVVVPLGAFVVFAQRRASQQSKADSRAASSQFFDYDAARVQHSGRRISGYAAPGIAVDGGGVDGGGGAGGAAGGFGGGAGAGGGGGGGGG